jgi:hypothetical protein
MADKKITALTALGAGDPDPALDLLHIIDYSASPVNKKITIANLFSQVDTDTTIYGASKTFEIGHAADLSVLEVLTNTVANTSEATVTINADSHDYVDFAVNSTTGAAITVDASADTVTINNGQIDMDVTIKGDGGTNIFSDGGNDCVGIGTATVDGTATLTVAADATTGHGIRTAGNLLLSGFENLTVVASATTNVSVLVPVSRITIPASGASIIGLPATGVEGQIKVITCVVAGGGSCTIETGNRLPVTAISFDAVGDTATFMYNDVLDKWMILSTVTTGLGS